MPPPSDSAPLQQAPASAGARPRRRPHRADCRLIDLALQGGGSHGAFTWGVLDRLLEDERLEVAGISGTSAGAMNAVALAAGLMDGGREGARANLRRFWEQVGQASPFVQRLPGPLAEWLGPRNPFMAPWHAYGEWLGRQFSPYQFNPLNLNPLREILAQTVDFERVRQCNKTQLFVAATEVRSGRLRVFRQDELSADAVLASACLPLLFQAVEIEGEAYWDGGYAGNPSLLPLITESPADDLLLVQINPSLRQALPTQARDIADRISEVTFNASLLKELRSIGLLKQLIRAEGHPVRADPAAGPSTFERVDRLRVHRLDAEDELSRLGASSKLITNPAFLHKLHGIGRRAAEDWLAQNFRHLGRRATFDLNTLLAP